MRIKVRPDGSFPRSRQGRRDLDATRRVRGWALAACLVASSSVWANMADNSHRSNSRASTSSPIRPTSSRWSSILGSMPAGDAMASASDNIAIPTLTGMMLDRGTKTLDKYAIAEQLDNVGAEISFGVGTQSLEIRAKCLKKDLPLVLGLLAAELRTPAFAGGRVRQSEAAVHRHPARIAAKHRRARAGGVLACDISRRPPEPSALDCGVPRRGQIRHPR